MERTETMSPTSSNKPPFSDEPASSTSEEQPLASEASFEPTLVLRKASLKLEKDSVVITDSSKDKLYRGSCCPCLPYQSQPQTIPFFNILWTDVELEYLTIRYAHPSNMTDVVVRTVFFPVDEEQKAKAAAWTQLLMESAYGESQRQKRIKILINPFGGRGYAESVYKNDVEPIFAAARCELDVEKTARQGHATEIAENIDINAFDVIAPCSGDGCVYEVFNGLAKKVDASEALAKIAVTHLPCGSGNAMCWNLNGTGSASMAALCIVKGLRTPLDLVSITQGNDRSVSFLSQSFGIIAECDLGTDNLRWMGELRFTYGFLVRLFGKTVWPCKVAVKVEIDGKDQIKSHYRAGAHKRFQDERAETEQPSGLPPLKYGTVNDPLPEGWELIPHDQMGNFYAGNMALMAADANFFPSALPNDGYLDLVMIRGDIPRSTAFNMMIAANNGTLFEMPEVSMQKISGYRLIPEGNEGYISVDGERIPFTPFQVEVHRGLGTVLSKSGYKYEAKGVA